MTIRLEFKALLFPRLILKRMVLLSLIACCTLIAHGQSWKPAAEDSILKYRTSQIGILITDGSGSPAEGVDVRVKMINHEFKWGTTVAIPEIMNTPEERLKDGLFTNYLSHFTLFNSVTPANAGKWKGWLDLNQRRVYLETMEWFESEGIENRGHTCVWESERFNAVPDFLKALTDTAEIRQAVKNHIIGQMEVLKDFCYEIDVVNELVHEQRITRDLLLLSNPAPEHAKWYKWAKQAAPEVDLIANEFDLFQSGGNFYQRYITYINEMTALGAPVDGVGMQGHFWSAMPDYEELKKRIERVKVLNLPMAVTEFDMVGSSYTDMERVLYAVFSEPQINNFTMWGAWDKRQWRSNAAMFEEDWTLKPSGQAWMDLVHGKWKTDTSMITGTDGRLEVTAFKGKHIIEIRQDNKIFVDTFMVGDEMTELNYSTSMIRSEIPEAELIIEEELDEYNIYQPAFLRLSTDYPDSISRVEYMEGLFIVKRDTLPDFDFDFTSTGSGTRQIYARVSCKNGYVFYTDTLEISFVNKNAFPIITSSYPIDNQMFQLGSEIDIFCEAVDYDGEIWKVEVSGVYEDSILRDFNYPYTFSLSGMPAGSYRFTLTAYDSLYAFDKKDISITVFDPDEQNISISGPLSMDQDIEEDSDRSIVFEGDLDMGDKICGIYFPNPGIPKFAVIDSAFIQFTTDNTSLGEVTIPMYAELNSDPEPFSNKAGDLSDRTSHTSVFNWKPDEWMSAGDRGPEQRTPDLKSLLTELQSLETFDETSPIVIITGLASVGDRRRVVSYDINPANAPKLQVYFRGGFDLSPPDPPVNLRIISQTEDQVTLDWDKPVNSTVIAYYIYMDGVKYSEIPLNTTAVTLENISRDVVHEFYVTSLSNLSVESGESNIVSSYPLGHPDLREENAFRIYPNPFHDEFSIRLSQKEVVNRIRILNVSGREIHSASVPAGIGEMIFSSEHFSSEMLGSGIYIVEIVCADRTIIRKLIRY